MSHAKARELTPPGRHESHDRVRPTPNLAADKSLLIVLGDDIESKLIDAA